MLVRSPTRGRFWLPARCPSRPGQAPPTARPCVCLRVPSPRRPLRLAASPRRAGSLDRLRNEAQNSRVRWLGMAQRQAPRPTCDATCWPGLAGKRAFGHPGVESLAGVGRPVARARVLMGDSQSRRRLHQLSVEHPQAIPWPPRPGRGARPPSLAGGYDWVGFPVHLRSAAGQWRPTRRAQVPCRQPLAAARRPAPSVPASPATGASLHLCGVTCLLRPAWHARVLWRWRVGFARRRPFCASADLSAAAKTAAICHWQWR